MRVCGQLILIKVFVEDVRGWSASLRRARSVLTVCRSWHLCGWTIIAGVVKSDVRASEGRSARVTSCPAPVRDLEMPPREERRISWPAVQPGHICSPLQALLVTCQSRPSSGTSALHMNSQHAHFSLHVLKWFTSDGRIMPAYLGPLFATSSTSALLFDL